MEWRHALRVLRRQAWIIALCVLVAAGVAYGLAHKQSIRYEATAGLLVQPNAQDLALPNAAALFTDPTRGRATAVQLITSPEVGRLVVAQLHPKNFDTKISATASGDSDVVSVTAVAPTPLEAAQLANAYASQYIVFSRATNQARYLAAAQQVDAQLAAEKAKGPGGTPGARRARDLSLQVLRQQRDRLHLTAAAQTGDAQIVTPASFPSQPLPRKEMRDTLLGAGFGLLLGLGLAFLRDRLSERITHEHQLAELAAGIPVVGYMPVGRSRRWTAAIAEASNSLSVSLDTYGFARAAESTRPVAAAQAVGAPQAVAYAQRAGAADGGRTLLVTSAMAEDGKSTTAVNLALASRERGHSVLLVDADLRLGTLDATSSLDAASRGLAGILAGKQHANEVVQTATFEPTPRAARGPRVALSGELKLIPSGGPVERPQTLFTGRAVDDLLRDVRAMADTVIIDGPPLGIVADMLPVSTLVDGVLVVVRLEHTRPRALKRLLEQLATAGVKPVGLVVIGAETGEYYYR